MTQQRAAELVGENLKTLYAWALSRVSNREDAEDLAGDVSLAVIENAHRLRCDDAFFGWFWQVARNTYSNFLKKREKYTSSDYDSIPEPADSDTPETITVRKESEAALYREIAILAKNHRECSVDYYFNELSVKEIAEKRGLTPESVKYYLFKTRKILKEGIAMERQFGEKSFNPTPFYLGTSFSGEKSDEYVHLFEKRKLPGQILTAAYYTPMSISELCLEIGVPTVYLEDEIRVLCNYGFLKNTGADKYQTQISVMDAGFYEEIVNKSKKEYTDAVARVCESIKEKLEDIKNIGFVGNNLDNELLLWNMLTLCMASGYDRVEKGDYTQKIGKDTVGYCYGSACRLTDIPVKLISGGFALFYINSKNYKATVVPFHENNRDDYLNIGCDEVYKGASVWNKIDVLMDACVEVPDKAPIPMFTEEQWKNIVWNVLNDEGDSMRDIINGCVDICAESMKNRAPAGVDIINDMFIHSVIGTIFSVMADVANDAGVKIPANDKHPGIIAIR